MPVKGAPDGHAATAIQDNLVHYVAFPDGIWIGNGHHGDWQPEVPSTNMD